MNNKTARSIPQIIIGNNSIAQSTGQPEADVGSEKTAKRRGWFCNDFRTIVDYLIVFFFFSSWNDLPFLNGCWAINLEFNCRIFNLI